MKLIPQNEVDSAALKYAQEYVEYDEDETFTEIDLIDYAQFDFKAGVSFAESKFIDILKDYTEYLGIETDGSLITQFIKDRNEKN